MSVGLSGGGAGPVHCPEGHSLRSMYISMLRARMLGVIRRHSAKKRERCMFDGIRDICTGDFFLPGAQRLQELTYAGAPTSILYCLHRHCAYLMMTIRMIIGETDGAAQGVSARNIFLSEQSWKGDTKPFPRVRCPEVIRSRT